MKYEIELLFSNSQTDKISEQLGIQREQSTQFIQQNIDSLQNSLVSNFDNYKKSIRSLLENRFFEVDMKLDAIETFLDFRFKEFRSNSVQRQSLELNQNSSRQVSARKSQE